MNDAHHSSQGSYLLVALAQKKHVNADGDKAQLVEGSSFGETGGNQLVRCRWCTGTLAGMVELEHQCVLVSVGADS